jgi:anthranilate phosphoribosyltransferase
MASNYANSTNHVSIAPLLKKLALTPVPAPPPTAPAIPSDDIALAFSRTFEDQLNPTQLASLLTLLHSTGYDRHPDVIAKCAASMRDAANKVSPKLLRQVIGKRKRDLSMGTYRGGLCDIVGTGGDSHATFNISTTASIIASPLLMMAKHGNRAQTSMSGSADVLNAILPLPPRIEKVKAENLPSLYEKANYAFLFAPNFHPGMKFAATVRRELGLRTIFNLMGPLANPVEEFIEARVVGVAYQALGPVFAEALRLSGCQKGMVVCGQEDLDEISCAGGTNCWLLRARDPTPVPPTENGKVDTDSEANADGDDDDESDEDVNDLMARRRQEIEITTFTLHPRDFGLPTHPLSQVGGGKLPKQNAAVLMAMLNNELPKDNPILEFVLMNVAALLVVSGVCDVEPSEGSGVGGLEGKGEGEVITERGPGGGRWKEGVRLARQCLESGRAVGELKKFIDFTQGL